LHILTCLKSTGKGAVIHPHGVLFRGGAEATIRREIVKRGYIKGIIGLPANLFYGTGIPACILVLDKENAQARKSIFMVDASKGFIKDGNKSRLRARDIHRIVDTFTRQLEVPRYARMVPLSEISDSKNDFNLNLPRYIDSTEPEDLQDIDGHLAGGIPDRDIDALDRYWQVIPAVQPLLFESAGRPGYSRLKVLGVTSRPSSWAMPSSPRSTVQSHCCSRSGKRPTLNGSKPSNRETSQRRLSKCFPKKCWSPSAKPV
jgi:type I restriction enzyme M protein